MTTDINAATRRTSPSKPGASLDELIEQLSQSSAYANEPDDVKVLQTHISVLFFAGDRVFKLKKSVDLPFLDDRDIEARKHFCEEQARLNRRISPSMYRGVLPVTREPDGRLTIDGGGAVVDWVVAMRRLPADRMLSALLDGDRLAPEDLHRIVSLLARFHDRAPTGPSVNRHGLPVAVRAMVEENLDQLADVAARLPDDVPPAFLRLLRDDCARFLGEHTELLVRRVGDWRIREGHGDLHAGNVCIEDERVHVYDCVEFSRALRCADVACDLAMLAMDLDHRGHVEASGRLVSEYAQLTRDDDLATLMPFYKAYRAAVRAKVELFTAESCAKDGADRDAPTMHRSAAACYAQLAVGYRLPACVVLVGHGTAPDGARAAAAEHVAGRLCAVRVRSDAADVPASVERAAESLADSRTVVVATDSALGPEQRPFVDAAARYGAPLFALELDAEQGDERTTRLVDPSRAVRAPSGAHPLAVGRALFERMVGALS